jgi:hypothetical protein
MGGLIFFTIASCVLNLWECYLISHRCGHWVIVENASFKISEGIITSMIQEIFFLNTLIDYMVY